MKKKIQQAMLNTNATTSTTSLHLLSSTSITHSIPSTSDRLNHNIQRSQHHQVMACFNRKKEDDEKLKKMCFPEILMEVLSDDQNSDSISWLPHGLAFKMTNSKHISKRIIPKYFKTIKYSSFIRTINRWGFVRITMGVNKGAYTHKLFQRENPKLCKQMTLKKAVKPTRKVSPTIKMVVTEEEDYKAQEIDVYRFLRLKANQLNGVQPAMKLVNEAQFHRTAPLLTTAYLF